ncbi:MAG: restriction endonuclease subunit S [Candidatus Methanoperedenaceae archaeon]|nr:restriction endonuclease subunit S [Candidatus Methanoperedenaceae archaeon]
MKTGWEVKRLGNVCDIVNGGTPDTKVKEYWDGENLWITPKDMGKLNSIFVDETERKITDSGLKNSSAKLLPINSIILSSRAPIGHLAINKKPMSTNQGCKGIVPKNMLDFLFLYYFLKKSVELLNSLGSGTTFKELSGSKLAEVIILLPPLSEQKRIIAILGEAFESITKAKENAEKNLKNANEIFESYLQSVFENKGGEWKKVQLSSLIEKGWIISHLDGNHGGDYPRKEEFINEGVPYISAKCLKGNSVDLSLAKYLTPERAGRINKGVAINNDVLFAHNATVGPVAILRTNEEKIILGTSLTYYRCNPEHILPEYLINYMRSKEFKQQYELVMRQSTRNQVPITKQREFYHIIPPVEIQRTLIVKLEYLFDNAKKLEAIYQKKLADLEELKKSILAKAFNGELTEASS